MGESGRLRTKDQAARTGRAAPSSLQFGQRELLDFHAESAPGGMVENLCERGRKNVHCGNARGAHERECGAAKSGGGELDGWRGRFTDLNQSGLGGAGGEFMRGEGREQNFRWCSPNVVDDHVKTFFGIFPPEGCG